MMLANLPELPGVHSDERVNLHQTSPFLRLHYLRLILPETQAV